MRLSLPALTVAAFLASSGSATAQTWPICFEGDASPSPEAYQAFREAAAAFDEAGPFRARVSIRRLGAEPASDAGGRALRRLNETYLELLRARVSPSYLQVETVESLDAPSGCLILHVSVTPPEGRPEPPALWHLRGVYFASGSTEIEDAGRYWIRVAAALNEPGRARYRLDGHTDTLGLPEDNLELSRRRVFAVADSLVREGVAWGQIDMAAYGETRLARPTGDEVPEALNRRVWIDIRYPASTTD